MTLRNGFNTISQCFVGALTPHLKLRHNNVFYYTHPRVSIPKTPLFYFFSNFFKISRLWFVAPIRSLLSQVFIWYAIHKRKVSSSIASMQLRIKPDAPSVATSRSRSTGSGSVSASISSTRTIAKRSSGLDRQWKSSVSIFLSSSSWMFP